MKNGTTSPPFAVALIQADHDGLCRAVTPDLLAWCGITTSDLVGQFIFQLFSAASRADVLAAWERITSSKESGRFEAVLAAPSDSSLPVAVDLAPVRGIATITDHWIVAIHPTQQAPTIDEGELRLLRAELNETRRRADEQLGALKEEIAHIQRAKDVLLSSIAEESKARIAALEAENDTLRKTSTDHETQTRKTGEEHALQVERLTAELTALRTHATPGTTAGAPAQTESIDPALRAENLTLAARVRNTEEEIVALRRQLTQAQDELARRPTAPGTTPELEALGIELRTEREAHAAERTAAERTRSELADLRERMTSARTEAEDRLATTTRQLEETEKARARATATLEEQRLKLTEYEKTASESSQFAQTAAREFKETLRKNDALAIELAAAREEVTRQAESIRRATDREAALTTAVMSAQREALSLREERDTARTESSRLEQELGDATRLHHHTTNEVFERAISEVTIRLNRILRLFFALPELRPEAPLCSTVAAARTAAEDLVHSLERIHEYWLIEAGGLALQRENFGLRSWLSSAAALYEFKANQRALTLTMTSDPEIPEVVLTDGARLVDALSQIADYMVETAAARSPLTFAAHILSATGRDVRVSFDFSAPCDACDQTTAQQLSLAVAERIVKLLGGEFSAVEAPGDVRRIRVTLGLLRGSGSPVPISPRSRRRTAREAIDPLPVRPAVPTPSEIHRTFGVEPSFPTEEEDVQPAISEQINARGAPVAPRGTIIPLVTPTDEFAHPSRTVRVAADDSTKPEASSIETRPALAVPPMVPPDEEAESESATLRILLAEDNKLNQRMIVDILKTRGYMVVLAADGREALTHLATTRFDLALIDCEMPTMDGYAATREIRAAEGRLGRHTPIFAMTVYLDNDIETKCLAAGTDELLTKPVRADALFALIDRYFPGR